ncbi:Uma2 family endonuclease [Streptomyces sp. ISL-22]|uniref:Uma2 family endonuclease n=1 Tax=unclassified Streptomyces TaxID=2593676 RepID=UPI001BE7306E|nr:MULTISPECIES: Uma2 family endonuclease [unclassified Streptomyces]MBT2421485.1 Uma2 family endonuclease [Streptomyces sp. ISL-24]MBT2435638.1 Uma2 family endonuclease [Streptomyces sp. ISL-22]
MSAAAVERPHADRPLIAEANLIMERLPGRRVEIIGGQLLLSPAPDGPHSEALMLFAAPFLQLGLVRPLPGIGLWLPTGPEDYVIPDLSVVDDDYRDHLVENSCYDPACFRLVMEVTSSNWKTDLRAKVVSYAKAKIPVYVIIDRRHQRLHVLTDPVRDSYATHHIHTAGELVTLPESVGGKVALDVAELLKAGEPHTND